MAENVKFISFREAASVAAAKNANESGRLYIVAGEDAMVFEGHEFYGGYKKADADSKVATAKSEAIASAKSYADQKVAALGSVYRVKGSVTSAELAALTSAAVGDVYNVSDEVTINGDAYPAGTNVVCVTAFSSAINPATSTNWDALSGLQDLSAFATKTELQNRMAVTAKYPTISYSGKGVTIELWNNDSSVGKVGEAIINPVSSSSPGVMTSSLYNELKTATEDIESVQQSVEGLNASVGEINTSLATKASSSDLQSAKQYLEGGIGANADAIAKNTSDISSLKTSVGTKASQSDLDALITRVAQLEALLKLN